MPGTYRRAGLSSSIEVDSCIAVGLIHLGCAALALLSTLAAHRALHHKDPELGQLPLDALCDRRCTAILGELRTYQTVPARAVLVRQVEVGRWLAAGAGWQVVDGRRAAGGLLGHG
jgi:hypothetical protein